MVFDPSKFRFIRKALLASEDLHTLVYTHLPSFDAALDVWASDLLEELENTVRIFHIKGIKVSADKVFDLASKRLEALHAPFLKDMKTFTEQIDLILARKALQYVKVCEKFQKPMKLEEQLKIAKEGQAFLKRLATTLHKINSLCEKQLANVEANNLQSIAKYKDLFETIEYYSTLTPTGMINRLKNV